MCRLQQVEELAPLSSRSADRQTWTSQTLPDKQIKKNIQKISFNLHAKYSDFVDNEQYLFFLYFMERETETKARKSWLC